MAKEVTQTDASPVALPAAPATPEPTPAAGGRYTRAPDGTLTPNPVAPENNPTTTTKD